MAWSHGHPDGCATKFMDSRIPELRINVNDADQPVHPEYAEPEAEVWYDPNGQAAAYGYHANDYLWMHWPGLATYRFDSVSNYVLAYPTIKGRDHLVEDTYLRSVLPFVLQMRGWQVLHASGVETLSGVAVFCGESGVGKSTLVFGLTQRGYKSWADDAVALLLNEISPQSLRLPFRVRLLSNSIQYFKLTGSSINTIDKPSSADMSMAPLTAIFFLSRAKYQDLHSKRSMIVRMKSDQAFSHLLQHAYCFMPDNAEFRKKLAEDYLELESAIPTYHLIIPEGLEHLPQVLDEIEQTLHNLNQYGARR
jgi:predicted ATPase